MAKECEATELNIVSLKPSNKASLPNLCQRGCSGTVLVLYLPATWV